MKKTLKPEAGLQPFVVAYHSQCILVDQQRLNGIYDLLQGGATTHLHYARKQMKVLMK
jgi:hypothetical protein